MSEAARDLGFCQVRSETDNPCLRPAAVEIGGVPFCERCAHEQEAYFVIGELTQAPTSDRTWRIQSFQRGELLLDTLRRMRRYKAGHTVEKKPEKAAAGSLR